MPGAEATPSLSSAPAAAWVAIAAGRSGGSRGGMLRRQPPPLRPFRRRGRRCHSPKTSLPPTPPTNFEGDDGSLAPTGGHRPPSPAPPPPRAVLTLRTAPAAFPACSGRADPRQGAGAPPHPGTPALGSAEEAVPVRGRRRWETSPPRLPPLLRFPPLGASSPTTAALARPAQAARRAPPPCRRRRSMCRPPAPSSAASARRRLGAGRQRGSRRAPGVAPAHTAAASPPPSAPLRSHL